MHWAAPTVIISSLLTGFVLAFGHHLFCLRLEGQALSSNSFTVVGEIIAQQQCNIAVGTTLAFFFKTSLALAVSIAFIPRTTRCCVTTTEFLDLRN